jgi:hypothetical protein
MSAREFALDLRRFGDLTEEKATMIFRKIALDLDTRIVLSTPVDTGRARGNWFPSINTPSNAVNPTASDRSGSGAINAAAGLIGRAEIGTVIWFTNNLPYILPLENGWSGQAPTGMVDINLNAVQAQYGGVINR